MGVGRIVARSVEDTVGTIYLSTGEDSLLGLALLFLFSGIGERLTCSAGCALLNVFSELESPENEWEAFYTLDFGLRKVRFEVSLGLFQ